MRFVQNSFSFKGQVFEKKMLTSKQIFSSFHILPLNYVLVVLQMKKFIPQLTLFVLSMTVLTYFYLFFAK